MTQSSMKGRGRGSAGKWYERQRWYKDKETHRWHRKPKKLTKQGVRMTTLAAEFVRTGNLKQAVVKAYGYMINRNSVIILRKDRKLWKYIHKLIREEMEKAGIDKGVFVRRADKILDNLVKRLDSSNGDIESVVKLSQELRKWMDMCGGDWAGLSNRQEGEATAHFLWQGERKYLDSGKVEEAEVVE